MGPLTKSPRPLSIRPQPIRSARTETTSSLPGRTVDGQSSSVQGLGNFGFWGLGFWGLELRVLRLGVQGFGVRGLGFWGLGFRVLRLGFAALVCRLWDQLPCRCLSSFIGIGRQVFLHVVQNGIGSQKRKASFPSRSAKWNYRSQKTIHIMALGTYFHNGTKYGVSWLSAPHVKNGLRSWILGLFLSNR